MFFVNLPLKNCFPLRDRETSLSSRPPLYYCCPSSSRLLFHTHAAKSPMKLIFKEHPSIKFFQSARSARLSLIPSDVTRFTFFLVFSLPFRHARCLFHLFQRLSVYKWWRPGKNANIRCVRTQRRMETCNIQFLVNDIFSPRDILTYRPWQLPGNRYYAYLPITRGG